MGDADAAAAFVEGEDEGVQWGVGEIASAVEAYMSRNASSPATGGGGGAAADADPVFMAADLEDIADEAKTIALASSVLAPTSPSVVIADVPVSSEILHRFDSSLSIMSSEFVHCSPCSVI